jgi:hypothetical protein
MCGLTGFAGAVGATAQDQLDLQRLSLIHI